MPIEYLDQPAQKRGIEYLDTPQENSLASIKQKELEAGLLGGVGHPMSREEARQMAIERSAKRAEMEGDKDVALTVAPNSLLTRTLGGHLGIPKPGEKNIIVKGQGIVPSILAATVGGGYTSGPARLEQDALLKMGAIDPETVDALGVNRVAQENPGTVMAGNLVGGLVPAGKVFQGASLAGRLGKAALLGAGYGASESLAEGGSDRLLNSKTQLIEDALKNGAMSTVLPAALEGSGAGKMLLQKALVGKIDPKTQEIAQLAKEMSIPITAAQATGSRSLGLAEKGLQNIPTSSGIMQAQREATQSGLLNQANKLLDENGPRQGVQQFGEELQGRLKAREGIFKDTASKLYDKFEKSAPPGSTVSLSNIIGPATEFIKREEAKGGLGNSKLINQLKTFLGQEVPEKVIPDQVIAESKLISPEKKLNPDFVNDFGVSHSQVVPESRTPAQIIPGTTIPKGVIPKSTDLRTFLDIRAAVNDEIKSALKTDKNVVASRLGFIKSQMDKSLEDFSKQQGGKVEDAFNLANSYYGKRAQVFNDPKIQRLIQKDPGQLYDILAQPGTVKEITTLKSALGPNKFDPVKRAVMEKILTSDGVDAFSPQKFGTSLGKFEPENLEAVFGKEKVAEINKFHKVAKAVAENEKRVGNPSGTAQNLVSTSYISGAIALSAHNPIVGGASIIAPPALAKLYTSESGLKFLTEAMKTPVGSPRASQLFSRLSSVVAGGKAKENLSDLEKQTILKNAVDSLGPVQAK
jgi:hypothetical protein